MSEYQSYTFLAIDRPLSSAEQAALRRISTRAEITAHRFSNVYHWGSLKAAPSDLVDRYFDAFLYVTNWGTSSCQLRVPRSVLTEDVVAPFLTDRSLTVRSTARHTVVTLERQDEEPDGYWDDEADMLSGLLPLRADLSVGDLRSLYLGWLCGIQQGDVDDDDVEPDVPPGLQELSPSLESLVAFLAIDPDLLAVAAAISPSEAPVEVAAVSRWLTQVPADRKDAWLTQVMQGEAVTVRAGLWSAFREAGSRTVANPPERRRAADLLDDALRHRQEREQREAAAAAEEARKQAAARRAYLQSLTGKEEVLWRRAERAIEQAVQSDYSAAVSLIHDLYDLSVMTGDRSGFTRHYLDLKKRYSRRSGLWRRLQEAGVTV